MKTITDAPQTDYGAGLLPLYVRALTHIISLGRAAGAENSQVTVDDAHQELKAASGHMRAIDVTRYDALTPHAADQIQQLRNEIANLERALRDRPAADLISDGHRNMIVSTTSMALALSAVLDEECFAAPSTIIDGGRYP